MAVGIAIFLVSILVCVSMIVSESRHQVRDLLLHLVALAVLAACFYYVLVPPITVDGKPCLGSPRLRPIGVSQACARADYIRMASTIIPTIIVGLWALWSMWRGGATVRERSSRARRRVDASPTERRARPTPEKAGRSTGSRSTGSRSTGSRSTGSRSGGSRSSGTRSQGKRSSETGAKPPPPPE